MSDFFSKFSSRFDAFLGEKSLSPIFRIVFCFKWPKLGFSY